MDDQLWARLQAMRIEPEGAALSFMQRLARDNGWDIAYAEAVYAEYLRFLYLARTTTVCPSDAVDQAWHLHLAYTRHYWDVLCGDILGQPLHHGPTAGGAEQRSHYRDLYADTLAQYQAVFGHPPVSDIWPASEQRFGERFERINRSNYLLLPRPGMIIERLSVLIWSNRHVAACACLLAAILVLLPGAISGWPKEMVFVAAIIVVAVYVQVRRRGRRGGSGDGLGKGDSDSGSGCGD